MPAEPASPQPDPSGQIRIPGPPRIDVSSADPSSRVISTPTREQEQSIRDRKQLLFDDEELPVATARPGEAAPTEVVWKPFREYLRNTPAAPLSNTAKFGIYGTGAVVLLLLLVALMKGG